MLFASRLFNCRASEEETLPFFPQMYPRVSHSRTRKMPMGRFDVLKQIEQLDPERDNMRIMHLSFGYEFSWDSIRSLEIALYRTYCVPSISGLLDRTGEFRLRAQRRYDDTSLIVSEMCKWGYLEGRGQEALERMNWAHAHYKISNEDLLYVLSTFIYEPIRWIDRFGWRPLCRTERLGYYYFWKEVGARMGITNIPSTYEDYERWNREFEATHFRFADTNNRVGSSTRELFTSWFPRFLAPIVRSSIYAMLNDQMIEAFGFPRPAPGMRAMVAAMLRLRGRIVRMLPARKKAHFFADGKNRTYPRAYAISRLGPPNLVDHESHVD